MNGDPRHSDHRPVIISTERRAERRVQGSKPFFFEAGWLEEEKCAEVVKEGWEQGMDEGLSTVEQLVGQVASNLPCWSSDVLVGWEKRRKKIKKDKGIMNILLFFMHRSSFTERLFFQRSYLEPNNAAPPKELEIYNTCTLIKEKKS